MVPHSSYPSNCATAKPEAMQEKLNYLKVLTSIFIAPFFLYSFLTYYINIMKFDSSRTSFRESYDRNRPIQRRDIYCYLSLLERFVEFTRNMPEKVMRMYLVRAEYRYFKWVRYSDSYYRYHRNPPLGKVVYKDTEPTIQIVSDG